MARRCEGGDGEDNPALDSVEGNVDDYVGYQCITEHLIFYVKAPEGFRRKAR